MVQHAAARDIMHASTSSDDGLASCRQHRTFYECVDPLQVAAMGGVVERLPLERIPLPDVKSPPSFQELRRQAEQQEARRAACMSGKSHAPDAAVGPWPEPWPQLVLGDSVRWYDELSASSGCLGRFTGASVMSILKQLAGVEADVGEP